MERVKVKFIKFLNLNKLKPRGMQTTLMISFSLISVFIMLILGIVLYIRFSNVSRDEIVETTRKLMEQTGENMEDYLVSMRQISDAVYYNVVKESDFSSQESSIQKGMNLLYEANRDNLKSIAIYNNYGSLMAAEPVASQKEDPNVTKQGWYQTAVEETENMHFSTPHIQNLFDDGTKGYYWVLSLSRAVELTEGGDSRTGVLLVDMDYSSISRMMDQINTANSGQYFYLCDSNGEIIYHPRQVQISDGIFEENNLTGAAYKEGSYNEYFNGEHRKVLVNSISYTGWKLVGVIPYSTFTHGMLNVRYFIMMLILLMAMMMAYVNRTISVWISSPLLKLNDSVKSYEAGEKPRIHIGGTQEIRHLGYSIQKSYEQIEDLMKEIVLEQNERRKSELDALQSQINPHFLYNTLESITWMVEGEKNDEAAFMITQLAKFFRISLSKGRTVISIKDELQHARSYMNIQKVRYKNAFTVIFDVEEEVCSCCIVKLVLQPILENAISYGVSIMDEGGEIRIEGRKNGGKVILTVRDNGIGMSEEEVGFLLTDSTRVPKRGSGVGLVNVNNRIQLLFGKEYGLKIESEPDEGTAVSIIVPAVPYTEENRKILEKGYLFSKDLIKKMEDTGMENEKQ